MREPLVLPAAALGTGILAAHFFYFTVPDLLVPALASILALVLAFAFRRGHRLRWLAVSSSLALIGMATQVIHRPGRAPHLNADDTETVLLSGCVVNPPVFSPGRGQFTLELAPKALARISVVLKDGEKLSLKYGQQADVVAKIRSPRNYQNPDSFDYVGYLAAQHIYWTGSVSSPSGRTGASPNVRFSSARVAFQRTHMGS